MVDEIKKPIPTDEPPPEPALTADTATCATCPYWDQLKDPRAPKNIGTCRYNPPRLLVTPQKTLAGETVGISALFPQTEAAAWCGQHPDRRGAILASVFAGCIDMMIEEFPHLFAQKSSPFH